MTLPNESAHPQLHSIDGNWAKEPDARYSGLTKREEFAKAAMQGIYAGGASADTPDNRNMIALASVAAADDLIAALNE